MIRSSFRDVVGIPWYHRNNEETLIFRANISDHGIWCRQARRVPSAAPVRWTLVRVSVTAWLALVPVTSWPVVGGAISVEASP